MEAKTILIYLVKHMIWVNKIEAKDKSQTTNPGTIHHPINLEQRNTLTMYYS